MAGMLRGTLGIPYLYAERVGSTQDRLRDDALPHGAVAVAEHQTAGRGRSGRVWEDEPSQGLLFSVLLRPPAGAPLPQLSLVAGLAVASALEREAEVETHVKWPNDVLAGGEKLAGILLEAPGVTVVCGIGINVNQEREGLPPQTRAPATSLRLVAGRAFDRGMLLAAVLAELEASYGRWLAGGFSGLAGELEARNALRGRRVRVDGAAGTAAAIADDGRLTVELDGGGTVLVESGEVELSPDETRASG
jgi:BirA family transcriptional regulator, biotin operon repressor / biotin---[acetyl-CoA-carboxylase] ligase